MRDFSSEDNLYVIQVGDDFFAHNKRYAFSKHQAIIYYNKLRDQLSLIVHVGNSEEKNQALSALKGLRAYSLRIH